MGVITKIAVQQKRADRYNIDIDGAYAFSADEAVVIEFQLKKGKTVTEAERESIYKLDQLQRGLNTAINYLSLRMRSEKEIRDYLAKKDVEPDACDHIVQRLNELGYINDEQFADAFIKTQISTTEKGPAVIKRELREKGIDGESIEELMEQFTESLQVEKAAALYEKQLQKHRRESPLLQRKKAEQYLLTKGYSASIISQAAVAPEQDEEAADEALLYQAERAHRRYRSLDGKAYRQKMKMALYRKGFDLTAIDRVIDKIREEEA